MMIKKILLVVFVLLVLAVPASAQGVARLATVGVDNVTVSVGETFTVPVWIHGVSNLYGADVRGADLSDADLRKSDLAWANLEHANLTGANLRGANLGAADFSGANLCGSGFEAVSDTLLSAEANLTVDTLCPQREDDGRCINTDGTHPACRLFQGPPAPPPATTPASPRHTGQHRGASSERDTHRQHRNRAPGAGFTPTRSSANTRGNARHSRPHLALAGLHAGYQQQQVTLHRPRGRK